MKTKKIVSVCLAVCLACLCFAGCSNTDDKVSDMENDITRLSGMISSLTDTVNKLKKTNEAEIAELNRQIADYETRLSLLESANEPPVLHMGDTYTLKSPTGIEMFKVRLLEYRNVPYDDGSPSLLYLLDFNIQRLNIPNSVPTDMYFNAAAYSESLNRYSFKSSPPLQSDRYYGDDFSIKYEATISGGDIPVEDVSYIIVGMPSETIFRDESISSDSYIIPYAKFIL